MNTLIHKGFLDSLDDLSKEDRRRVRDVIPKLNSPPLPPGLRWHSVTNGFISLSPSMSVRIIAQRVEQGLVLLHVGQHDPAYAWAERHVLLTDPQSDVLEIVTLSEAEGYRPDAISTAQLYRDDLRRRLLANHVPEHIVAALAECQGDDEVLDSIQSMSPEWQEVILKTLTGETVDQSDIPDTSSTVRVLGSDVQIKEALALPFSTWKAFLHPKQREIVEDLAHRVTVVVGGPGTGKSVVCVHRASFLARHVPKDSVCVILTFSISLVKELRHLVNALDPDLRGISREQRVSQRRTWVFPLEAAASAKSSPLPLRIENGHLLLTEHGNDKRVDALVVDEFQDCATRFLDFLDSVKCSDEDELVQQARAAIQRMEHRYDEGSSLAVIHLQYWIPQFHRKNRVDPIADALKNDTVLNQYYKFGFWTKGREYLAGVVVCPSNFMSRDWGNDNLLRLNTMFVALSRFREELVKDGVARPLALEIVGQGRAGA